MSTPKIALLGIWVVLIGIAVAADGTPASVAQAVLAFLVLAHGIECLLFVSRLRRAGGSLPGQVLQTLVFGLFHLRELPHT